MKNVLLFVGILTAITSTTAKAERYYQLSDKYQNKTVEYVVRESQRETRKQYATLQEYMGGYPIQPYVGIEYQINNSLRVRGLARFVDTDDEYIKSITEFSLGLRYLF